MNIALLYGGLTHHYISSNLNYCNRINNNGSIFNEYYIAMVGSKNNKVGIIKGKDSVCGNIFGVITSNKIYDNLDMIIGGYNTNLNKFKQRNISPPNINKVTPVIGLNFKIPIYEDKSYKINFNNVISYGIITHSIGVEF